MKRPYQPAETRTQSGGSGGANPFDEFRGLDVPVAVWSVEATLDTSEGSDRWLFIWDTSSRADGPRGEPLARIPVANTGGQTLRAWPEREPLICKQGFAAEWSSDPITFTSAGPSSSVAVQYKPLAAWLAERECGCRK